MRKYGIRTALLAAACGLVFGKGLAVEAHGTLPYAFVETDQGVMWLNEDGTWAADCWLEIGDMKFRMDKDGYLMLGFTEVEGKTYYLYHTGTMATGWLTLGEDVYFFGDDGVMLRDTMLNGYQFGSDGRLIAAPTPAPEEAEMETEEKTPLALTVDGILASIITPEMTEEQKIKACYDYMVTTNSYKRTYETPEGDWTADFAMQILTTHQGNCYRFAAGFGCLLKGLGYETRVATGHIGTRRGGLAPHGWTEVYIGDDWYIFDTEMQYANGKKNYYFKTYETYPSKPLIKRADWPIHF